MQSLKKKKFECDRHEECNQRGMKCSLMDNHHWKMGEPQYEAEKFCYCQSASNNTYMCLRTVNETHNFMYCVFENERMDYGKRELTEYYDYKGDPGNVMNQFYRLRSWQVAVFDKMLNILKRCSGMIGCNMAKGVIFDPMPDDMDHGVLDFDSLNTLSIDGKNQFDFDENIDLNFDTTEINDNSNIGTHMDYSIVLKNNNQLDLRNGKKLDNVENSRGIQDKRILAEIENALINRDSVMIDDSEKTAAQKCGRRCRLEKQRVFCKKKKNKQKERCVRYKKVVREKRRKQKSRHEKRT